jgi:hypothetical protein
MDGITTRVRKNLQLNVARRGDVFLDQNTRIAERTARLALRGLLQVGGELNIRSDHYVMWHNVATSPAQVKTFNSDRYEK